MYTIVQYAIENEWKRGKVKEPISLWQWFIWKFMLNTSIKLFLNDFYPITATELIMKFIQIPCHLTQYQRIGTGHFGRVMVLVNCVGLCKRYQHCRQAEWLLCFHSSIKQGHRSASQSISDSISDFINHGY